MVDVGTTNYPTTLDSHANGDPFGFARVGDGLKTLLSAAASTGSTSLTVEDLSSFHTRGILAIGTGGDHFELVTYTGVSGTTQFTGVTRGVDLSSPLTHVAGSVVAQVPVAKNINDLAAAIVAIETKLGAGTGNLIYLGGTGTSTNANMTNGITIQQGAADDDILALKSSDVNHASTNLAEADTFGRFRKASGTDGGLAVQGFADTGSVGFSLQGLAPTNDTTKSTAATATLKLVASKVSGGGGAANDANANLLVITDHATTRFILDADGDSHQDVGTAWTNFHGHDDLELIEALAANVSRQGDPIRGEFAAFLFEKRDELERLRLVSFNDDGHPFVNMSRLTMLLVGALQQVQRRFVELEQGVALLRGELHALKAGQ